MTTDRPRTVGSLTKAVLIKEVVRVTGFTKRRAELIVDTVFGSIVETLHRGEKIELRGFGSLRLRRREPRRGRNPMTGDLVDVSSKRVAYFKPGKELKKLINRRSAAAGAFRPTPALTGESTVRRPGRRCRGPCAADTRAPYCACACRRTQRSRSDAGRARRDELAPRRCEPAAWPLQAATDTRRIFEASSDEPWVIDGADGCPCQGERPRQG